MRAVMRLPTGSRWTSKPCVLDRICRYCYWVIPAARGAGERIGASLYPQVTTRQALSWSDRSEAT
jgi:hypothetical protein